MSSVPLSKTPSQTAETQAVLRLSLESHNINITSTQDGAHFSHTSTMAETSPLDSTEATQIAKFVFYFGNELLAAHPSLRAASMLGRAGCSLVSIAETSNSSLSLESGDTSSENTQRSATSPITLPATCNGTNHVAMPAVAATFGSEGQATRQTAFQANLMKTTGKVLGVTGDSIAALGYVARVFNADPLSSVLLNTGFGFISATCYLNSFIAMRETQQTERALNAISAQMPEHPAKKLLTKYLQIKRNANLCNTICRAGYGTGFLISYIAPYASLGVFAPLIIADYTGKFKFNTGKPDSNIQDQMNNLSQLETATLMALLTHHHRAQSTLTVSLPEQSAPSAHILLKKLTQQAQQNKRLKRLLEKNGNTQGSAESATNESDSPAQHNTLALLRAAFGPHYLANMIELPAEKARALLQNKPCDYNDPDFINQVKKFLNSEAIQLSDAHETQTTSDQDNNEGLAKRPTEQGKSGDHDLLLASLSLLDLSLTHEELSIAQLYDRGFKKLSSERQKHAQYFHALSATLQSRLTEEDKNQKTQSSKNT